MNKIFLSGYCASDTELATSQSGTAIATTTIAINKFYRKGNETVKEVGYYRIKSFGKMAENVNVFAKKGEYVIFEGSLENITYEKDGIKKYQTDILASSFQHVPTKRKDGEPSNEPEREEKTATGQANGEKGSVLREEEQEIDISEIPL